MRTVHGVIWIAFAAACVGAATQLYATDGATATQTLQLREWFGVNHPEQVVEFTLNQQASSGGRVLNEAGTAVPFQLLERGKKLAVRTDLRANSTRVWRWFSEGTDRTPSTSAIQVTKIDGGWEIANELIAFRVPSAEAIKLGTQRRSSFRPLVDLFNHSADLPRVYTLAPLQGARLRDGTWTALGPNALVALAYELVDATVDFLEVGPLKTVIQLRYEFKKPAYNYGQHEISPAGPGFLLVKMYLSAGHPSILIEEDTDLDEVWSANFWHGVEPDQAQYKGHHSTDPKYGHTPDGSIYLPDHVRTHFRGEPDASVDLQYRTPQLPSYVTSKQSWRFLSVWDPWVYDSGWYWQLYNSVAGPEANLVSIFAGPASRALSAGMSGAGIFTLPSGPRSSGQPVAGISSQSYRRGPDARIYSRSRFSWGLFLGVKGHDLFRAGQVPTVNIQSNLFGGAANLTKIAAMKAAFPDPPQGYGAVYMDKAALESVIARVRRSNRQDKNSFYRWLYDAEPSSRALIDAWADTTGAKMRSAAADIIGLAHALVDDLVNGHGIYSFRFHYWHGGLEMMRRGLWIDQVLASDRLSSEDRARVKAAATLFGYVLWDNDFVPIDNWNGFNLGTPNMPEQQQGYRFFYAQLLAAHPDFTARAKVVQPKVLEQVQRQINEHGAHFGAPHYISASFAPTLNTLMQIKQLSQFDPFRSEPRLAKFAEFYLNLLTPPEIRFPGKPRSYIALGDSSTEASPLYGQLGTAFRDADPTLSRRLMGAWLASGKPHSGFFGTTAMAIDDRLPAQDPALKSATFPGYYSVLRSGWGTPDETAAWIVNGNFYRDHRSNDAGNLVIYALGAPLSVHWGSIYSPPTPSAYYHSSIVPEAEIGRPWDEPDPPPNGVVKSIWQNSSETGFSSSRSVDTSVSKFVHAGMEWTRTLRLHHSDPSMPLIVIRDEFAGPQASAPKVLTLNLLAHGAVQTPGGALTPELRTHPAAEKPMAPDQLPSAGPVFPLANGVSRLSFTGQFGIDFELFVIASEPQSGLLGNWADTWTQQSGKNWEERQHILRIRGSGPFQLVVVPFRTGQRPADLKLEVADTGVVLTANGTTVLLAR
jgi:hypothetical protein